MAFSKKFIEEQKRKLETEKIALTKELNEFASEDPHIKGNWEAKFPDYGAQSADFSEETDQVEEYEAVLPVEHALEIRLQKINNALRQIKKNTYGTCQKCRKKITAKRLKTRPEADICISCANKQ